MWLQVCPIKACISPESIPSEQQVKHFVNFCRLLVRQLQEKLYTNIVASDTKEILLVKSPFPLWF